MAVIVYSGIPGTGKTMSATHYAVVQYLWASRFARLFRKPVVNKIYSNYPILLDEKRGVYSHPVNTSMLQMNYKFPHGAVIIIDEVQREYDSREFKTFPKELGVFLQHHRHASIKRIILVSQHPKRIDNKMRDLAECYRKYKKVWNIPFLPFLVVFYNDYYEFDEYGSSADMDKKFRNYDVEKHIRFMLKKYAFKTYNTKYFHVIFDDLTPINTGNFASKDLTKEDIDLVGYQNFQ